MAEPTDDLSLSPTGRLLDRDSGKTLRAPVILDRLMQTYEGGVIELDHSSPFELLIATVLSAQSTDVMINQITKRLFVKYRTPEDYLSVPEEELQEDTAPAASSARRPSRSAASARR
jgi:endonuclease III